MTLDYGNKLPTGYYMLWRVDNKTDTAQGIVDYFKKKYGYAPTEVLVGDKVEIDFPSSSKGQEFLVPEHHVKMR